MARTVLIVDDERDTNEILASLVQARGYGVVQLFEGQHVVDTVRRTNPDVILLDLMLPDVDGYTVCEQLKRTRETNLIPVVMVTALGGQSHRTQGVSVGANVYITKPFLPEHLFKAMDEALAWRQYHETHGTKGEIQFHIRGEMEYLHQANDLLTDLYTHTPLTERQIRDLRQAVMEMGGNAIEWGHRRNAELPLRITYRINSTGVTLVIQDQGPGFNPGDIPHAANDEDPIAHLDVRTNMGIREGGFGIMLARGLVDEFRYNESGNEVTLIKRFEQADIQAHDHAPAKPLP